MVKATFIPTEENKISPTIHKTSIDGLFYIPHKTFLDDRGFYSELCRIPEIEELTKDNFVVKQLNQSRSNQNVTRGIHAESWNKLINVTSGICYCVLVDLRPDSSTFGKYESFYLGENEKNALSMDDKTKDLNVLDGAIYTSSGIGNSLCVVKGPADYIYAVDAIWAERDTSGDKAINLFDKDLNIDWPIPREKMILSQRDIDTSPIRELFPEKF
jgi:dTDP-4-dehydrorhamnose 3,5-epimerase-like enzyme